MRYTFFDDKGDAAGFCELNHFPGCNQIAVSGHSCIYPESRGQGLGSKLAEEKISQAKMLGFDYMIATVISTNLAQLRIMQKNNWTHLDSFINRESGNTVYIFGRRVNEQ